MHNRVYKEKQSECTRCQKETNIIKEAPLDWTTYNDAAFRRFLRPINHQCNVYTAGFVVSINESHIFHPKTKRK